MPAPQWPASTGVIALLSEAPYRFGFFQTVRLLERWLCRQGARADSALHDGVRFHHSVALVFPACEIEAVWHDSEHGRLHLRPSFMGLLGVNGTLPLHYTERLVRQERVRAMPARARFSTPCRNALPCCCIRPGPAAGSSARSTQAAAPDFCHCNWRWLAAGRRTWLAPAHCRRKRSLTMQRHCGSGQSAPN